MSAEKITHEDHNQTILETPVLSEVKFNGRVDINHLIARARKIKEKENKINLVFFGLISALVLIVGILLSF
jgi:hypothetical protein